MKNFKCGKVIESVYELKKHKSVYVKNWNKAVSTAFFLSWQFRLLDSWINKGLICESIRIKNRGIK